MVLVVFLFHHQEQRLLAEFEAHKSTIAPTISRTETIIEVDLRPYF